MIRALLIFLFLAGLTSCRPTRVCQIVDQEPIIITEKEPPVTPKVPPPVPVIKKHETIVIDAGHGGKDTGALSEKEHYEEKQLTLTTARMLRNYLEELGYETVMTREYDAFVPLCTRAELANSLKATLFVSVHYNFCPSPEVEGIEVFYYKDDKNPTAPRLVQSKKLCETVLSRIVKHTGAVARGVKTANFAVIRETKMPAILIECGFLSNKEEREKIKDPKYLRYLAWGIARGVDQYLESLRK